MPDDLKNLTAAQLAEQIEYHNRKYWAEGEPEISDDDYDALVRALTALEPDHKMRFNMELPVTMSAEEVQATVLAAPEAQKWMEGKTPKKVIFVPKKIVNIVI